MQRMRQQHGFTLVELVTVLVILGLLAVAVLPRMLQRNTFEARTAQDTLISAARQAQQLAMNKAVSANVQLITDNTSKRIRISYTEGGTQTIDTRVPDGIDIDDATVSYSKRGDADSAATISINSGERNVCISGAGFAYAC